MTSPHPETDRPPNAKFSAFFLMLHVAGALFATRTLLRAWDVRNYLQIYWGKLTWLACLGMVAVLCFGLVQAFRVYRRWRKREPELEAGIRLRGLIYVAIACVVLNVTIFAFRMPVMAEISAVLAYGIYSLWFHGMPRIRSRFPRKFGGILDVACMNVTLALILAEASLRVVSAVWPMPLFMTRDADASASLNANRVNPGSLRYGFPINEGGHFDTPFVPTEKKLVVSIGDSFANAGIPHPYHFTTICEQELGDVEVYNMGFPGIGPREYLELLKTEALPLNPDLIVCHIFVGNDVTEALAVKSGPPAWFSPERYLVSVLGRRIRALQREGRVDLKNGIRDALPEHDKLTSQWPWLADPMLEQPTFSRDLFFNIEMERVQVVCRPNKQVYHWFFESLRDLERAADEIPIAYVLIPDEFQVNDELWKQILDELDPSGGRYDRDRPQTRTLEQLEHCGLPVLDLLPELRAVEPLEDGKRHLYHLQDTHFNVRGHRIAGKALAKFVGPLLAAPASRANPIANHAAASGPPFGAGDQGAITQLIFGQPRCGQTMVGGWSFDEVTDEITYVWSEGSKSVLALNLPVDDDLIMQFECRPFVFPGGSEQSIEVNLNGQSIAAVSLHPNRKEYSVALAKTKLSGDSDTPNIIEFRYAHVNRPADVLPDSLDSRSLAVCWYRLSVTRSVDRATAGTGDDVPPGIGR